MTEETGIIRAVLEGDTESFRLLVQRYQKPEPESTEDIANKDIIPNEKSGSQHSMCVNQEKCSEALADPQLCQIVLALPDLSLDVIEKIVKIIDAH